MTQKQIAALIATGVVACSTVLCWPGDYDYASSLYRAILINIANVFITEIPNFRHRANTISNIIKSFLTIFGFILVGIGFINISSSEKVSVWEYVYFGASVVVCCISVINFIETMLLKESNIPKVAEYDPSEKMEQET